MISYPINSRDHKKFSMFLANELITTNDLSYIQSILTDEDICTLQIWDYVKSPKANPEILKKLAETTNHDTILRCIAENDVTTVETLTIICSDPEKYWGWSNALRNPKATKKHALMMIDLRKDDSWSGAYEVACSRFLDKEIAEKLFAEYSLIGFNLSLLAGNNHKKETKQILKDYEKKMKVMEALFNNELVSKKWRDMYLPVAQEHSKATQSKSFLNLVQKNN